jgi:septal ring factor EnvC (AmiA/AmiB activator)
MPDFGILEICGIGAAISAGLGGPIAMVRWCASFVGDKVAESERTLKLTIDGQGHKIANVTTRLDSVEREHQKHIERTVRLETNLQNLEKGQERIEHQLEKMEADSERGRSEIIDSLRELRNVSLKD